MDIAVDMHIISRGATNTPSPSIARCKSLASPLSAAAAIGRAAAYTSAGTIEFLVDADGQFYFLEMNTRLQVEHPITEAVTGLDFVRAQIEIAGGATLASVLEAAGLDVSRAFSQGGGHAIEVRIYAENPELGFLPSPGLITHLAVPAGPGVRVDSGAYEGWTVPTSYDALVSKLITWGPTRAGAIQRMVCALQEYDLRGIDTTIGFCRDLVASREFAQAEFDTTYVDRLLAEGRKSGAPNEALDEIAAIAASLWGMTRTTSPASTGSAHAGHRASESLWAQRARLESLR